MYSLRIKTYTPPTTAQVEEFKAYVGQSGTAADTFLASVLAEALVHIGEWHDVSLLAATYELEVTEREDNDPVRLYLTPNTVTGVTDLGGNTLAYEHTTGGRYVTIPDPAEGVRITYTTTADAGSLSVLLPKVWEYGRAKYEGRPDDAAKILMR